MKRDGRKKKGLNSKMKEKIVGLFFLVIALMIAVVVKIVVLQTTKGNEYSKKVLDSQVYSSQTLYHQRGSIMDRNGTSLAVSERVYNLIIDSKVMNTENSKTHKKEFIEPTLAALEKYFPQLQEKRKDKEITRMEEIRNIVTENPDHQYFKILENLSYEEIQEFLAYQNDEKNELRHYIKGAWFEQDYIRSYPYGSLASHVIGFGNLYGLEGYYNEELTGKNGRQYGYIDEDLTSETETKRATDGYNLVTTLDVNVQLIVEKCIKEWNDAHKDGARPGLGSENTAVMVVNPNNGEILGQATYPTFDLNQPTDLSISGLYTLEQSEALKTEELKQEASKAYSNIWKDYCVTSTFEPGSTIKPFTVAEALEVGAINGNEMYVCDGGEQVADYRIKCVSRNGHGELNVGTAVAESCNDVMMQIVRKIGKTQFLRFQNIFGWGKRTGIDLPNEVNTSRVIHTEETMRETELATCSFGQGFNVNMLQIVGGFASLINGGTYYQPHMVKQIQDHNGGTVENKEPVVLRETVSKETSQMIREYLKQTVMEGTGNTALVPGYTMGGKTGTAETFDPETNQRSDKDYVVSFIGYAPADNPQVMVYVVINKPNVEDQAHSSFAQEIAHNIFKELLPYMKIFPTEPVTQQPVQPTEPLPETPENAPENAPAQ